MRRINHPAGSDKNPHMRHPILTIPPRRPKNHISRLGLRARDMPAHAGRVLHISSAGDGAVPRLADGVLGETGAIEASVGRAGTATAAEDVGKAFFFDGGVDDGLA